MICFNDFLNTNVGGCPTSAGIRAQGYLIPRSQVVVTHPISHEQAFTVNSGDHITPVWMDMDYAFKIAAEGTRNDYGLTKFNKTIELFLVENTALTQKQIAQLNNDFYVAVIFDQSGQAMVFGLERGLKFVSSSQDFNSTDTHGGIVVIMTESAVNVPMVFANPSPIVPLIGVTSATTSVAVGIEASYTIDDYVFITSDATVKTLVPKSSDESIFTAAETGTGEITITGVASGAATLSVYSLDGNHKLADVTVTVG